MLAARTSFVIALIGSVILFFLLTYPVPWNLVIPATFFLVIFLLGFFILRFSTERFVQEKLSLIYQTMHQLKRNPNAPVEKIKSTSHDVSDVEEQVLDWYLDNKKEIDRLNLLEQYRREFIGNVSHELKTPVFNIQGYLLTLLEGGLEDETINRKYLERAEKSVEKLIKLLNELDMIIRLDTGGLQLNIQGVDIVSIVKDVVESIEFKAEKRNIKLNIKRKNMDPIWVMSDEDKISQVISNLLINSIKYGKENGRIDISFHDLKDQILVEIQDDGIGIADHELTRIFERFYRTDEGRRHSHKGFGLGLSIVKHIIEAHKQPIHVNSEVGKGSTFSFTLKKVGKK